MLASFWFRYRLERLLSADVPYRLVNEKLDIVVRILLNATASAQTRSVVRAASDGPAKRGYITELIYVILVKPESIQASTRTNDLPRRVRRGSISRQIPCSAPKGGNNSLLAQINSLLVA